MTSSTIVEVTKISRFYHSWMTNIYSTNQGGFQQQQKLISSIRFWHSSRWRTIATININQTLFVKNKVMKFHQNRSQNGLPILARKWVVCRRNCVFSFTNCLSMFSLKSTPNGVTHSKPKQSGTFQHVLLKNSHIYFYVFFSNNGSTYHP